MKAVYLELFQFQVISKKQHVEIEITYGGGCLGLVNKDLVLEKNGALELG